MLCFTLIWLAYQITANVVVTKTYIFEAKLCPISKLKTKTKSNIMVPTINCQYPGPSIRVKKNQNVVINLTNNLHRNFSLHFHGIDQRGSHSSDGVPYLSQEPIMPNKTYTYSFNVGEQSGTYYYHAHTDLHSITAFGPFIIEDDVFELESLFLHNSQYMYDEEKTLMLSDYFDKTPDIMYQKFKNTSTMVDDASRVFLNLIGEARNSNVTRSIRCTKQIQNIVKNKPSFSSRQLSVVMDKRYRIRLVCATTLSYMSFSIQDHNLTVIEADGKFVEPYTLDTLQIGSGQRYSVIIQTKGYKASLTPYLIFSHALMQQKSPSAHAYLVYDKLLLPPPKQQCQKIKRYIESYNRSAVIDVNKKMHLSSWYKTIKNQNHNFRQHYYPVPKRFDSKLILDVVESVVENDKHVFLVNKKHLSVGDMIGAYYSNYVKQIQGVYKVELNNTVELVIQNRHEMEGDCSQHPWHLHGMPFYVLESGSGLYNHQSLDKHNVYSIPVLRDTVNIMPDSYEEKEHGTPCGWVKVGVWFNNPGLWLFHCHITQHAEMGMGVIFKVQKK